MKLVRITELIVLFAHKYNIVILTRKIQWFHCNTKQVNLLAWTTNHSNLPLANESREPAGLFSPQNKKISLAYKTIIATIGMDSDLV